ncbi:alpha/beta family hydrolase [Thiohalorhabdus methylotrophus]|uniref:Alpha/beta family hydrolase n=1 Tax=Thiohalorhabdus methylotrophus TaxID=3242694 RepID=A0ABV4TY80_9GAMM
MDYLFNGPEDAALTIALAHGAGAPMDSPFMEEVAEALAARSWRVARFEFPYMVRRREDGKKRPPDRQPVLLDTWRAVIADLGPQGLVIGGKSMGGRMASLVAEESGVPGLVCLGYPFHPPGKPDRLRIDHLRELATPALIVQGTRDPFGNAEEVAGYPLSPTMRLHWAEDGNHDLAPRKRSGRSAEQNLAESVSAMDGFLQELSAPASP